MALIASLALLTLALSPLPAWAWNIPGHILSGIIAYQILQQENPATIDKVIAVLEKHPWYANQWQTRLQDVPVADHGLVLFMQAARWPDDIRMRDKQYHRARGGITSIGRLSQRNNRTVRTCKKLAGCKAETNRQWSPGWAAEN